MKCQHRYSWYNTIHGDCIIALNYKRTVWKCILCNLKAYTSTYVQHDPSILFSIDGLKRMEKENGW